MKRKVTEIKIGDFVDLEGDLYADPNCDHPEYEFECSIVQEIKLETPDCIVVYFDNTSIGFPLDHELNWVT